MKARTKLERRVEAITLPDISEPQKNYFISHVIKYHIYHNGKYTCPDCGKTYSNKKRKVLEDVKCPHCGCKGKSVKVREKYSTELSYGMTTCRDGFQIIRMFIVWSQFREGKKAEYTFNEVYRNYINEDGRTTDMCVGISYHFYENEYKFGGDLHIYKPTYYSSWATDIAPHYWNPKGSIIPKLRQRGFKGSTHDISPRQLMEHMLQENPEVETIYKAGYYGILEKLSMSFMKDYFGTIKIAIRNRYKAKNWVIWRDYISMCKELRFDIMNPKVVYPEDLNKAHDDVSAKKRRHDEKIRERLRKELEKKNLKDATDDEARAKYAEHIKPYMGIEVKGKGITIKPIPTSDDFFWLGKEMHQCLATNAFYKEFDSVILSAWVDGKVLENMQISLSRFKVIQCFGNDNKFSSRHEQILELVSSKLIDEIKKCYLKSKTA